jgi:hypothetical protein
MAVGDLWLVVGGLQSFWDHSVYQPIAALFIQQPPQCRQNLTYITAVGLAGLVVFVRAIISRWKHLLVCSEAAIDVSAACIGIATEAPIAAYCFGAKEVLVGQSLFWLAVPLTLGVLSLAFAQIVLRDIHAKVHKDGVIIRLQDWGFAIGALGAGFLTLTVASALTARFLEHGACR